MSKCDDSDPGPQESSTPREETPAKVTVTEESPEQSSSSQASMSQKKRLLAKAHSDWMLAETKTEPGDKHQLLRTRDGCLLYTSPSPRDS